MHHELSTRPIMLGLALAMIAPAVSNNQAPTVTPIRPGGAPLTVLIEQVQWTGDPLPAIHTRRSTPGDPHPAIHTRRSTPGDPLLGPDRSVSMDDPTLDATLQQGFNIDHAASLAMWSES